MERELAADFHCWVTVTVWELLTGIPGARLRSSRLDTTQKHKAHNSTFDPYKAPDIPLRKCVCKHG